MKKNIILSLLVLAGVMAGDLAHSSGLRLVDYKEFRESVALCKSNGTSVIVDYGGGDIDVYKPKVRLFQNGLIVDSLISCPNKATILERLHIYEPIQYNQPPVR